MKSTEVILYKRTNNFLRFFSVFITMIILFVSIIGLVDSIVSHKEIMITPFVYFIIMLIISILLEKYTGYTDKIIVKYNLEGFSKGNKDFIEWKNLKSWSLKTKIKYHSPIEKLQFPNLSYFEWSILLGTSHIHKLELVLNDNSKIIFSDEEVGDITKFIKYLLKNYREKCKEYKR